MTTNQSYGAYYGRAQSSKKESIGKNTLEFLVKNDSGNYILTQQNVAQRSRHGLFSQPMGLANGDHYHDAKPEPVPKNVSVNNRLIQKVGPEVFEKMGSTNIGDLYKDKFRQGQLYNKQKADLSVHNHAFLAGGRQKLVKNSEFEHLKEYQDKAFNTRDEQGNVKVGNKNVTTNNMKRGFGSTNTDHLFGNYQYMGSPYENPRQFEKRDKMAHKAKILKPFIGSSNPLATFTPNYQAFHIESEPYLPRQDESQYRSKTNEKWTYNNANKKGPGGTFTEFPKYIDEGEKSRPPITHQNVWKPNPAGTQSMPCPVLSQMALNGKK